MTIGFSTRDTKELQDNIVEDMQKCMGGKSARIKKNRNKVTQIKIIFSMKKKMIFTLSKMRGKYFAGARVRH